MTSQALNRPVDVLAVMDADAHAIALLYDLTTNRVREEWEAHLPKHDAARAAVAELIESNADLIKVIDAAGLMQLATGVQPGPTVWYVKANDAMCRNRLALAAIGSQP